MKRRTLKIGIIASFACCLCASGSAAQAVDHVQPFSGPFRVTGMLVNKVDGHPLAQARATLADTANPQKSQSVITSQDGKFMFPTVPAGKFSLTGFKRGYIPAAYDQHDQFSTAIVTGAGLDTENLVLKLASDGMIFGRILDEAGDPVRHATVTLYYDDHSEGIDRIRNAQNATTDDLGEYELTSLRPGTYYLSATAKPWYAVSPPSDAEASKSDTQSRATADRSLDVAYPLTYYPDTTDSDSASPIPVRGGERLEVDIHLNPVPALRLRFRVSGDSRGRFEVPQFEQHSFGESTHIEATVTSMVSPGVIEVSGIPAGRYDVSLIGQGVRSQISGVDLTTQGQEVDTSAAEASSNVKMSVQLQGASKPAELIVALRSQGKLGIRGSQVDANGEAEIQQIPAGQYEVVLFARGRNYSISRVTAEGAEVSGRHVTIAAGSTVSISVTATAGSIVVQGIAKRASKPFPGAMVVLVPKDVEGNRDLFRRDQSDLDGTFSLRDVTPGKYTLVAIENGWDLDWSQPEVIAVYAKHGRAMEVTNTPGKPLRLEEPIQVVSK
jgi:Carboxypeptidase regulatory-like domain